MSRIANKEELIEEIHESVQGLIEFVNTQVKLGKLGNPCGDSDTTERGLFSRLLGFGLQLMALYFAGLGDGDEGKIVEIEGVAYKRGPCSPRSLLTVFGIVGFKRFLYYRLGGERQKSLKLLDARVNLPDSQASYFVRDWLCRLGVKYTVYEEAIRFFRDLFGVSMSKRTAEEAVTDLAISYDDYEEHRELVEGETTEGELCVIQADGKGVPMHVSERSGEGTKKEALVGCVYTVNRHERSAESVAKSLTSPDLLNDEQKQELRDGDKARNIHYRSSLEQSKEEEFERLAEEVSQRRGSGELVCVLDGAAILLKLARKHFSDAKIILDIIHVLDYLWPAVHAFEKEGTLKAQATACYWLTLILSGKVGYVIGGLRQRLTKKGNKLSKNKEKMSRMLSATMIITGPTCATTSI